MTLRGVQCCFSYLATSITPVLPSISLSFLSVAPSCGRPGADVGRTIDGLMGRYVSN